MSDKRNYKIIQKLGQGSFGTAYKVLNKKDKKFYVLKEMILQNLKKEDLNEIFKEASILAKLQNDYIVRYVDSFFENNRFNIVMEFCEGLDLRQFINENKKKNKFIAINLIYSFILDLAEGIKYLHSNNIIHRDLKPDNIFIDKSNRLKIGDFGISIKLNNTRYADTKTGTFIYMAPEIIKGEKYNNKVDIWALGCIIYELCTLNLCFYDSSILGLCNKIIKENHGKINLNLYSSNLQNLIDIMLCKNYKMRPNIDEVYNLVNKEINNSLLSPYLPHNKYYTKIHPHPLFFLGLSRNNGWACNGKFLEKKCFSGITDFNQSTGIPRFRCETCDFDLCRKCMDYY